MEAGMTGIRLNLSHSTLKDSERWIVNYFKASEEIEKCPRLMIDLQGPELRIGNLPEKMILEAGKIVILGGGQIPIPDVVRPFLKKGQTVGLDDGKIRLKVLKEAASDGYKCQVICGGDLISRKSIVLYGCRIENPTLTKQDKENLSLAQKYQVSDVMLPFVRGKEDLLNLREELDRAGCSHVKIFAKVENMSGVEHLEELIPYCDYIVIARGDLGNAMPLSKLPVIQHKIGRICKKHKRKFLIVTQMLNSMINSSNPTRAEVNDIFQAVMQGASAIMLTGETAIGKYPAEAMKVLIETAKETEKYKKSL